MKKLLNFILGGTIIFLILYISILILKVLKISFPAPIFGIIIFFILLKTGILKENLIKDFCEFMLKYMILFFIPAFVGIIAYMDILEKNLLAIILTICLTTILVMVSVGLYVYHIIKLKRLSYLKKEMR